MLKEEVKHEDKWKFQFCLECETAFTRLFMVRNAILTHSRLIKIVFLEKNACSGYVYHYLVPVTLPYLQQFSKHVSARHRTEVVWNSIKKLNLSVTIKIRKNI